jgi:two-component system LytT family sensor kinase
VIGQVDFSDDGKILSKVLWRMKNNCEECGRVLPADGVAYVCSYGCTFCPACTSNMHKVCSKCGGELVPRPPRAALLKAEEKTSTDFPWTFRPAMVWGLSFGVWTFVALAYAITVYQSFRSTRESVSFLSVLGLQSSIILTYAPLTPFVFAFANRYPVLRSNWAERSLVLLAGSLVFTMAHVALRSLTPYAFWDPAVKGWASAVWDSQAHAFRIHWDAYRTLFLQSVVDDVVTTYFPIVLIAHVASYYRRLREREVRTSQLQTQLARARTQALKSQLQPHFLFNTLNSISALMLTDVKAADRMITRLGDLLRISLETAETQMTTLSRELEFVNCYVEIEKVRFEERLKVSIDVAPEALDAVVPHLLLQPLVDNAIKHGISKLVAGGEIRISATADDTYLHLEVRDNGPGVREPGPYQSSGVGLRITRERLETIYGQRQSLELLTLPEGGAVARVSIPLHAGVRGHNSFDLTLDSLSPGIAES